MPTTAPPDTARRLLRPWPLLLLLAAACASPQPRPAGVPTTVNVGPAEPGQRTPAAEPLPALPVARIEEAQGTARRIQQLDVVDQDLRVVLRTVAHNFGLDFQIDPAVSGRVTTRLHNVTLEQALDAMVLPHGYSYQIHGNVLRIVPARMPTRIFALDYVSLSRMGVGTTTIQRSMGTSGATGSTLGGGGFGGGTPGAQGGMFPGGVGSGDMIQNVTVADLWEEIRVALEGLVFSTAEPTTGLAAQGGINATRAPGPYSRVGEDGRKLILNPMAGTIVVTAPADKLEEVAVFITTVERSVQRQVLVEAKIVEVSLNRQNQFGIDWSLAQRIGNLQLQLGAGQSGAQFTLDNRGDAEGSIRVMLRALQQQGEVSVLSSPQISVLNNQRATFGVTTDQVFFAVTRQPILGPTGATIGFNTQIQPQQVAVGITLDVLAQIAVDNTITMNVRPVVTDVIAEKTVQLDDGTQASAPVIDRREVDTVVRVRGGETIVIGGLMQNRRSTERGGVPVLRDIPLIGGLFGGASQQMEKRELVIFITPRIIAGQPQAGN